MSTLNVLMAAAGAASAPAYNYATLDPATKSTAFTLSNGNLTAANGGVAVNGGARATQSKTFGKWYWEVTVNSTLNTPSHGVYSLSCTPSSQSCGFQNNSAGWLSDGRVFLNAVSSSPANATYANGDVLGFAYDTTAGTLALYKNGTLIHTVTGCTTSGYPGVSRAGTATCNFGASAFAYSVPSGFRAGVYIDPSVGQVAYTTPGTYSWTVPTGVTSVCVVCVGGGSRGGGGLAYGNNIAVTPGASLSVQVGSVGQASWFINSSTLQGGGAGLTGGTSTGSARTGGGAGGGATGGGIGHGGGGAGGYSGTGGVGGNNTNGSAGSGGGGGGGASSQSLIGYGGGGGGGVGLLGEGSNGTGGSGAGSNPQGGGGGSGGSAGAAAPPGTNNGGNGGGYGGGGGERNAGYGGSDGAGAGGAVRIIWGLGRSFPSTNTGDM